MSTSTPKTMFRAMALTIAVMVVVYVAVGQILADRWQVETSRSLAAEPARVRSLVQDLGSWKDWCAMDADRGPQTRRTVEGTPGTVGHRATWSGAHGEASLTLSAVTADGIEYEFRSRDAQEKETHLHGRGHVSWKAEGTGTRVTWLDGGTHDGLVMRWIGWFGALQERMRQLQSSSLQGLEQALAKDAPKPAAK